MKFLIMKVENFGKISDLSLELEDHLNIICGKNESGKTTLITFIYGMLYSFIKPRLRRRSYEEEKERYRPWQGGKYGGELVYALDSGQEIRVQRDFDKSEVTVLGDKMWNDLTESFQLYLSDPQFAQEHLGIEKEIFRDCLYIRQQNIDTIKNPQVLTSRLQSIAATSTEDLSLQKALKKLERALEQIGTKQARKTSLLGQCVERIEQLQQEREQIKNLHNQLTESIEELNQLRSQKASLQDNQQKTQYLIAKVGLERLEEQIEKTNQLNQKIDQKEQELTPLESYEFFFTEIREELIQLNADIKSQKERQGDREEELKESQDELGKVQQELQAYAHLESLTETSANEIAEKKTKWLELENNRKKLKQTLTEQEEAFNELKSKRYEHTLFSDLNRQIEKTQKNLKEVEKRCHQAKYKLLSAELEQIKNTIETVNTLKDDIDKISQKLKDYESYANFPVKRKDELLNFQTRLKDANERVEGLENKLNKKQVNLTELQEELKSFSGYEQISEDFEEIEQLRSKYESLINTESQQKENLTKLKRKVELQSNKVNNYESKFSSLDKDKFEQVVQDVANIEQTQTILSLKEKEINRENEQLQFLQNKIQKQRKQAKLMFSVSGVFTIVSVVSFWFFSYLSFGLAPFILGGLTLGFYKHKQAKEAEPEHERKSDMLKSQKSELAQRKREVEGTQMAVDDLFREVGVDSVGELKIEYDKLQKLRQNAEQINNKVEEISSDLETTQEGLKETVKQLQELMEPAIPLMEDNISEQLDTLRKDYRQYQSLLQKSDIVKKEVRELQSELKEEEMKADNLRMQMTGILTEANLKTVEQFLEAVKKHKLYQEAVKEKAELKEKLTHLTGKSIEELNLKKDKKQEQTTSLINSYPDLAQISEDVDLPQAKENYEQSLEKKHEVEQNLKTLQAQRETRFSETTKAQREKIDEIRERFCKNKEQQTDLEEKLKDILLKTKLLSSEDSFSVKSVDNLLNQLDQYNHLKREEVSRLKVEKELSEKLEKASKRLDEIQVQQESLLQQVDVETFEEYQETYKRHQQFLNLKEEIKDLERKRDKYLKGRTLEECQQQAQELRKQIEDLIEKRPDFSNIDFTRSNEEEYQKDQKHIREETQEVEKRIHGLKERIQTQMGNSRPLYEVKEELEQSISEKVKLEKQKDALVLAKEELEIISQEFITTCFAPELRSIITPMLQTVIGRYEEIHFDDEMNLKVRIPNLNLIKGVETLSQGTLDQVYFILKSGVAQMLSKQETLPFLLDEPFVTCDDERLKKILDVLGEIASQTQILLFTCHRWQMDAIAEHFGYDVATNVSDVSGEFELLAIAP